MSKTILARCPECGAHRFADVLAQETTNVTDEFFGPDWSQMEYRIVSCRGCGTHFFQTVSTNSDDMVEQEEEPGGEKVKVPRETVRYYPSFSHRKRPTWTTGEWTKNKKLRSIADEMYAALDNELPVLAAIGMRTVFDVAIETLGVDPAITFAEKLDAILDMGKISKEERDYLDLLVDAGSAAVHRGWQPQDHHLDGMVLILEGFLHRTFLLPLRTSTLRNVPGKQKRQ